MWGGLLGRRSKNRAGPPSRYPMAGIAGTEGSGPARQVEATLPLDGTRRRQRRRRPRREDRDRGAADPFYPWSGVRGLKPPAASGVYRGVAEKEEAARFARRGQHDRQAPPSRESTAGRGPRPPEPRTAGP